MSDKAWLLNPSAIRAAKKCIQCVQDELGVKLKLSHPEFMEMLHEYVDLTDSETLGQAYSELLSFTGVGNAMKKLNASKVAAQANAKVVPIAQEHQQVVNAVSPTVVESQEPTTIEFKGKTYPLWRDGKRFKGLYRGQPNYI